MKALSFGEILFDVIEGESYLGGAPLNFAAHLAQLGAESWIYSRVGTDALGGLALEKVARIGVKTDFVQQDNAHPTGTVPVEFRNGHPHYTILEKVAYDYIAPAAAEPLFTNTDFDVLYFGTLIQRSPTSKSTLTALIRQKTFTHIFYDVNLRKDCYTKENIRESLGHCTILKLNDEEVEVLSGMLYEQELEMEAFARQLVKDYAPEIIVITAGGKGCYVYESGQLQLVRGYPATVVDTVGAGDAFSAAFVYHYAKSKDALKAADRANKLGAFVASSRGPLPEYSPEIRKALEIGKA